MEYLKKTIVLFLLMMFTSNLVAQELEHEAPTLQVGLDGLNFTKGTLDPAVIATIIAEKQREIKIKIIQNSFLKKIYGSGGTIYNYADNIIKGVIQEPDTDIRTRKIMESTVNLVFVYAFTDFYLKEATKRNGQELTHLNNLAIGYELPNLTNFNSGLKYRDLLELNPPDSESAKNLRNVRYANLTSKRTIEDEDDYLNKFMALLIDTASEVVRHNEKLRDLGVMRVSYSSNYDYLNIYKQQQNSIAFNNDKLINPTNKVLINDVYDDMKTMMEEYTNYIGALKYITELKSFKSNDISSNLIPLSGHVKPLNHLDFNESDIESVIKKLSLVYTQVSKNNEHVEKSYLKDIESAIQKLTETLSYLKKAKLYLEDPNINDIKKVLIISDILYTIRIDIIPIIEDSVKFAPDLLNSKDVMTELSKNIYSVLVSNVSYLKDINKDPSPFIQLVSRLYEFDKTKTFSEYTKLITLLDEVFEAGKIKNALSMINTFVKDYTEVTTDENGNEALVFNVESFLVKLESLQTDKINRFQFHFTVGVNTTSFLNGDLDLDNGESISNFSHFSEKIGLKIKLINRGDWLSKDPGETYGSFGYSYIKTTPPKEPLISNWHLLLYGSGVLYSVIDSSTNKEFDFPIIGFGTGITFFNDLDFNISMGFPILSNGGFENMTENAFVSFGFDLQIAEYLKGVAKKKRERKRTEKLLSKS